ncbi:hypothetical protein [Pseudomonas sp. BF-R-26]|uniref:hypothetical protein n=1 Tax=Pseudomonas sp. BF-R-26 TaxID=2832398 RepID=UPI001CBB45DC|nr:hypothetical protein [Pseudomonas sp. BF-R-26]
MSSSMGIASAFVLSSLFLSPFAMAEESQTFVAQNAVRTKAYEQFQSELTAKTQEAAQIPQASSTQALPQVEKDS